MAKKIKESIYLTRPEITVIHHVAALSPIITAHGLTAAQVTEGINYHRTVVKTTMADLVILGLAKQTNVKTSPRAGRTSHVYSFYHPNIEKLSRHYNNMDNFTMREEERQLAPLVLALHDTPVMYKGQAVQQTTLENFDSIVERNKEYFSITGWGEIAQYSLTEEGKQCATDLKCIQRILEKTTHQFINGR